MMLCHCSLSISSYPLDLNESGAYTPQEEESWSSATASWVRSLPLSNVSSLTIRLIYNILGSSNLQVELWIRQTERKKNELKDPKTGKFARTWNSKAGKAIYIGFQKAASFLNLHPCTMSDFHIFGFCKEGMKVSHPHMVYTFFKKNVFHQL